MSLPSLDQESDLPLSLSLDLTPTTNSPKDVTDDVLLYAYPPTTFNDSFEFEEGRDLEKPSELDMSITTEVKRHDDLVCSRLDCFLVSADCEGFFQDMIQKRLSRPFSDHFPICLETMNMVRI